MSDAPVVPTALEGIRVADFTRQMSGPYATLVLADFGADVVKVESSPQGDPSRRTGTNFIGDQSTMFLTWNRNKRSICLDMRTAAGLAAAHRLIESVDVVMENFRPGVADEIGIGWDTVRTLNDRAIYVSVNAFGSKGPWRERPGTDPIVQAMSGVMSVTGEADGGPVLVGIPVADYSSAMVAVQAVLLGLLARNVTGKGQHIEVPMFGSLLFGLTTRIGPYFLTGEDPQRFGSQHSQVVPYQAFETQDGWVVAGVWGDGWEAFCAALDWPELVADERFDTNSKRVAQRDTMSALLSAHIKQRTSADWEERFVAHGVLFSPVNSFSDIVNHPQTEAMGLVLEVDHPRLGPLQQIGPVILMDETPGRVRTAPPDLGQHTREVLTELGYDEAETDELFRSGACQGVQ